MGKKRKKFLHKTYPKFAIQFMVETKKYFDPKNVFAINNTFYTSEEEERLDNPEHSHH